MRRLGAWLALAAIATAAPAQDRDPRPGPPDAARRAYANPSAVIAAEMALARLAQDKGQWTAFRETAAPDAVLFGPHMVLAQQWLKDRANPAAALRWQPYTAWSSCDGSLVVATGAWQDPQGQQGRFVTIWQRQEKGGYKWVLNRREPLAAPIDPPEMIAARVADCSLAARPPAAPPAARGRSRPAKPAPVPFDPARREGSARDGTLRWLVTADPAGGHALVVEMAQDGEMRPIGGELAPPAP